MGSEPISYANLANLPLIETLYAQYQVDPNAIDPSWRHFFEGMQFAFSSTPVYHPEGGKESPDLRVYLMIDTYRRFGHLMAQCNPISTEVPQEVESLKLEALGFKKEELEAQFPTCGFLKEPTAQLKVLIEALRKTYCNRIGVECTGLGSVPMERWIQDQIEPYFPLHLDRENKLQILHELNKAELFESFLHTKYVGQKRFSLEGCETLIPMLSALIAEGAEAGVEEAVLGMAHRGRLNVLTNILNKSYSLLFHEFEDHYTPDEFEGTGDVKYHKGFIGKLPTASGKEVVVTLVANPSHLESVDPVVEGIARAKQELVRGKKERTQIVPILIHGDAAVAGQGVVYETMQLSRLNGYSTGGTIHLVINNQIGFTTLPKDSRSTRYSPEIGHAFGSPVFHVNAEDPEGCVRVARLATQIRQKYECDVFIDINCYRKYGHNESDEPTFTQPLEYSLIKRKQSIRALFRNQLIQEGILTEELASTMEGQFKAELQKELEKIGTEKPMPPRKADAPTSKGTIPSECSTAVAKDLLNDLARRFCTVPEELRIHPKIQRLLQERLAMLSGDPDEAKIDWGMGEHLAYASLVEEKVHVRISGQDVRRGTFSHRHAIWVDQVKEQKYFPLSHLSKQQAPFDIFNSPLSEFAVLGFEFGYSLTYPKSLTIWEAQFGDFANSAQVIIDQYIASSEQKWSLPSNITLMLPHGNEGQGPEHTSARIERYLQLAGHDNMRIANCTTPAQLFHLIRAQGLLEIKKPLILFTPKALLRHPKCVSSLNTLVQGRFQEVIDDSAASTNASRIFFCSGKIYYDLIAEREKRGADGIAIIRVEQLYPYPKEKIAHLLNRYSSAQQFLWVQEEHSNMGAWEFIRPYFNEQLGSKGTIQYVGRDRSASPAAGSHALHQKQQATLMQTAFNDEEK